MVDSNALHLGIDFGSFNIKALLCTAALEPLRQLCEPTGGYLKTSLLQTLDSLLSEFPNTLQLKVAVTGSGQSSIKSLEAALLVNEVLATALGAGYLLKGPRTDFLIGQCVAKIADFLGRGAAGVINAAGINCMVGTATTSVIPSNRAAFGQAPVITLVYSNSEGPTQRIQLETFVHQVQRRWKSAAA